MANGTTVRYYVTADDDTGFSTSDPANAPAAYYSYTVSSVSPPPVADGKTSGTAARFSKSSSISGQIDVSYGTSPCSTSKAVIVYGTLGSYSGYAGCAQSNAGNAGAAPPVLPAGGFGGQDGAPAAGAGAGPGAGGGAAGGLLDASRPSSALEALLKKDAGSYTWVAATVGAQSAAGYQLATGDPVMSLGGFNGSDPYPTLAELQALVQAGRVHYFIAGGMGGGGGAAGSSSMSAITTWVTSTYTAQSVGGVTLYDLTSPTTASSK